RKSIAEPINDCNQQKEPRHSRDPFFKKRLIDKTNPECLILLFVFCPSVGTLNSFLPAFEQFSTGLFIHLRLEYFVNCPVSNNVFFAVPVSNCQTCQISGAHSCCLNALWTMYRSVDDICLELHQEVVSTSAAVNLEGCQFNANV